jgi:hypothetical protein
VREYQKGDGNTSRDVSFNLLIHVKYAKLGERLIESVNTVTNLLRSNTALRENIERLNITIEKRDATVFVVRNKI